MLFNGRVNFYFSKCYEELKLMKNFFPTIPIMATTATLQPYRQDMLCESYLRNPIIVRSTVNNPNVRISVMPYEQLNKKKIKVRKDSKANNERRGQYSLLFGLFSSLKSRRRTNNFIPVSVGGVPFYMYSSSLK